MSHLSQAVIRVGEMSAGLWKLSLVASLLVSLPLVRAQASSSDGGDNESAQDDPTLVVSQRYLERLLHVYGEDGSISLKGLEHMLLDISQKNDHRHFEHHDHSLFEEHSTDEHIDLDHAKHGGSHISLVGDHSDHADHSDHDHSSHTDHSDHDHSDHEQSEHADHTKHSSHDDSQHTDHSDHTDHSHHRDHIDYFDHDGNRPANHSDHSHEGHADHSDHDHSGHTDHSNHDHSEHADHSDHDHSKLTDHSDHNHNEDADHGSEKPSRQGRDGAADHAEHSNHQDHPGHDHSAHLDHDQSAHADHDHSAHADHDHSAHADHDHSAHADHDHSAHADHDHSAHADHDHSAHADHDHSAHADHDHSAHADHDHSAHADHDHSAHADHDHSAHADHDHSAHADHDHSAHADHDHSAHADHDHSAHLDHDHSAHADHDHSAHADHDHSAHADHDHSAHADHDHSAHADHDHSAHADHDHSQRAPADHERGLAPRDGGGVSEVFSSQEDAVRHPRALQPTDPETATVPYSVNPVEACPSLSGLLLEFGLAPDSRLSGSNLSLLCPALVYRVSVAGCREFKELRDHDHNRDHSHNHGVAQQPALLNSSRTQQWLFAGLAVLCISLCGLAGVAVVPIMQRVVYRQLLQFLVALAVGTLAGDALLHLLPHALTPHKAHSGDHGDHADDHGDHGDHGAAELDAVLKGLVALSALLFFFVAERAIGILHGTCTRGKTKKIKKRLAGMRHLNRETTEMIGQRISSYRHSAGASHCFADSDTRDVLARLNDLNDSHGSCDEDRETEAAEREALTAPEEAPPLATSERASPPPSMTTTNPAGNDHLSPKLAESGTGGGNSGAAGRESCERFSANERVARSSDFTVIIHEHEHRHHGHTHTHGHIHQPPGSAAAVAGMVIVGDGLHNFTDGMAIGAAFAAGMASGLSTSVAVFCHELPHEIGDFAVLLQSGMSVRQALFYNVVSSVLCLFGMVLGMLLGNLEAFSSWVFAAAAGSFLYIALVDMIPELTTSGGAPDGSSPCGQLTVQLLGMCCGAGIMLAIAIYEHDLHSLVTVL